MYLPIRSLLCLCPTGDRGLLVAVRVHRDGILRLLVLQDWGQRTLSDSHGVRKIRDVEWHVRRWPPGSASSLLQWSQLLRSALLQPRLYGFRSSLFNNIKCIFFFFYLTHNRRLIANPGDGEKNLTNIFFQKLCVFIRATNKNT